MKVTICLGHFGVFGCARVDGLSVLHVVAIIGSEILVIGSVCTLNPTKLPPGLERPRRRSILNPTKLTTQSQIATHRQLQLYYSTLITVYSL